MRKILTYLFILFVSTQCRERYDIPYKVPVTGYLVVEGIINYGGVTTISLSRTTRLADRILLPEADAALFVEGEDHSTYPLTEQDSGKYTASISQMNPSIRYRLNIKTTDNKEYISDFRPVINTPPIDSISWKRNSEGLEIFVNSSASENDVLYYKWDYEETWEFHSKYPANLKFKITEREMPAGTLYEAELFFPSGKINDSIYQCWQNRNSTDIKIGSTAKLNSNVAYKQIRYFPEGSWELSFLYSIKIKQYGLGREAYGFYERMKKNTESLGSIFDAQPSELNSNIQCITNPEEKVVGYIEVCSVHEKRIFISKEELPKWNYFDDCLPTEQVDLSKSPPDFLRDSVAYRNYVPTVTGRSTFPPYTDFFVAERRCVDCTTRGYHIKPSFWP